MEKWVRDWIVEKRNEGKKGLEIKQVRSSYYVYQSTSYWDKESKKPIKKTTYLGKLDQEKGMIPAEKRSNISENVVVEHYGNALVLDQAISRLVPVLKDVFTNDWKEIYALAVTRAVDYVPLREAPGRWGALHNLQGLKPDLFPQNIASLLSRVGSDTVSQSKVFDAVEENGEIFHLPMSTYFSMSDETALAEIIHDQEHVHMKRVTLDVVFDSAVSVPQRIQANFGKIEFSSLMHTLEKEKSDPQMLLLLKRGALGEIQLNQLNENRVHFIQPARANSPYYKLDFDKKGHFFHGDRLIRFGRRRRGSSFLFMFEDVLLRAEEETVFYRSINSSCDGDPVCESSARAFGSILIVSNMDLSPERVFALYKRRNMFDDSFDKYRRLLNADKQYIIDDNGIIGHAFIFFLSLYIECIIRLRLLESGLEKTVSLEEMIHELSNIFFIADRNQGSIIGTTEKARWLEKKLGLKYHSMRIVDEQKEEAPSGRGFD